MQRHGQKQKDTGTIAKELFFGVLAIGLGGYNLLNPYLWKFNVEIPQLIGNILLALVGFVLVVTAFKLWRYRWHTSRLF